MADAMRDEFVTRMKRHIARYNEILTVCNLLTSGEYSDFIVTSGSDTYNVHKAIVCPQSSFFRKAESFSVGTVRARRALQNVHFAHYETKEAAEGKINLPEDDPKAVSRLIKFFYESEYEPKIPDHVREMQLGIYPGKVDGYSYDFPHTCQPRCPINFEICPHYSCNPNTCNENCVKFCCAICTGPRAPDGDASQLLLHSKLYGIAEKYDVVGLKILACEKFARACKKYWDDEQLMIACQHALTTTPEHDQGLRQVLHDLIATKPELLDKPGMDVLLGKETGFAFGVLKQLAAEMSRLRTAAS